MKLSLVRIIALVVCTLALGRSAQAQFATGIYVEVYLTDACPGNPSLGDGWAAVPGFPNRGATCPGATSEPGRAYGSAIGFTASPGFVYGSSLSITLNQSGRSAWAGRATPCWLEGSIKCRRFRAPASFLMWRAAAPSARSTRRAGPCRCEQRTACFR